MANASDISFRRGHYKMVTYILPSSKSIIRMRDLLLKETSCHIDLPSCDGEASSTGNIARNCFSNKRDFLRWSTSTITPEDKEKLITTHANIGGAILRVCNSSYILDIVKFEMLCKSTLSILLTITH